jgi:hypothetical protein
MGNIAMWILPQAEKGHQAMKRYTSPIFTAPEPGRLSAPAVSAKGAIGSDPKPGDSSFRTLPEGALL